MPKLRAIRIQVEAMQNAYARKMGTYERYN